MTFLLLSRRTAVCLAIASVNVYSAASIAGNMSLTIDGISSTMEILSFKISATNPGSTTGGGGGGTSKPEYGEFQFTAPESAATPLQFKFVSTGEHAVSARLQVLASDTMRPLSEWTLQDVELASVGVESGAPDPKPRPTGATNFFLAPQSSFSLRFSNYCYRVFAADGSVAQLECFDIKANTQT